MRELEENRILARYRIYIKVPNMLKITKHILPNKLKRLISNYKTQITNFKILAIDYAQFKTIKNGFCVDKIDNPVPWYTYPTIEFLQHIDFSNCSIFEFGSGYSTLFWLERAKKVVSIEHNKEYYKRIKETIEQRLRHKKNYTYLFFEEKEEYTMAINLFNEIFDVIIIDGMWRSACTKRVIDYINRYGGKMLIFDNSDWSPKTINFLRQKLDWIEVDFHGFGPINGYTWTTSIFLAESLTYKYNKNLSSIGCLEYIENEDDLYREI